ncbi:hypothetical protein XANCAGTX0491_001457 [Xanthoria calcicola]
MPSPVSTMEEPNRARCGDRKLSSCGLTSSKHANVYVTEKAVRKPVVSSDKNEKAEYSQSVPTSGPPKHAQASDPIWGNAAWSPRMKTMKHLTCYSENHTLRRFLTCAFTATSWQSERHVCCASDYSWAAVGNCRNGDNCYFFAFGISAHGIPKTRLASQSVKDPAVEPAGAGKNAQKDNLSYIASSRGRAPFNFPRAKMGRVPGPAREHVSRRKPTQRAPCHCPGYHGQS